VVRLFGVSNNLEKGDGMSDGIDCVCFVGLRLVVSSIKGATLFACFRDEQSMHRSKE